MHSHAAVSDGTMSADLSSEESRMTGPGLLLYYINVLPPSLAVVGWGV